ASSLEFASGFAPAAQLAGLALGSAMSSFAVLNSVAALAAEIYAMHRRVKANHRMCRRLAERVMSLQSSLARLAASLQKADHMAGMPEEGDYHSLNMHLMRVLQAMERSRDLIQAWGGANDTFFGKLKRALLSSHFHEEFVECGQELSECLADLRGDATLQMFDNHLQARRISLPSPGTWPGEDVQDSHTDLQMIPAAIASVADTQAALASSLAMVHLNVQELKSGLEAHGVTAASWEKGFVKLEIKLDRIETKLDSLEDMKVQMSKIEEMLQHNHNAGRANKNAPGRTSSKGQFLREKMPHLSIPYANLRIMEEVGSGGFGTVYRGFWQGTEVAYKEIMIDAGNKRGTERQVKELYKEAYIMSLMRSPLVCSLYGVTLEAQHYGLVLPFHSGGALDDFLRDDKVEITQDLYLQMALTIATAMAHLHNSSQAVVHGDLKSRNVLLATPWKRGVLPKLVLCDFGLSTVKLDVQSTVAGSTMASMAIQKHGGGTLNWKAPELFEQDAAATKKSDVYAFAMLMYELVARKYPFEGLPDARVIQLVVDKNERPNLPPGVLPAYAELMKACWGHNPTERPSFFNVQRRLQQMVDMHCISSVEHVPRHDHTLKSRKAIDWMMSMMDCGRSKSG
ncbi:hypothetical protein CYMTET_12002, partial [Cymbomonas tetramitiformis]